MLRRSIFIYMYLYIYIYIISVRHYEKSIIERAIEYVKDRTEILTIIILAGEEIRL